MITNNWLKVTHLFSYSFGEQTYKMGGRAVFFLDVLDRIHFLALFSSERLPEFLGSWPLILQSQQWLYSDLCSHHTIAIPSLTLTLLSPSLHWAHADNLVISLSEDP